MTARFALGSWIVWFGSFELARQGQNKPAKPNKPGADTVPRAGTVQTGEPRSEREFCLFRNLSQLRLFLLVHDLDAVEE